MDDNDMIRRNRKGLARYVMVAIIAAWIAAIFAITHPETDISFVWAIIVYYLQLVVALFFWVGIWDTTDQKGWGYEASLLDERNIEAA
jgi:hypothetical protein